MKKALIIFSLILMISIPAQAASVTNIELKHSQDATVAVIHVDGKVRYVHETVPPKDGVNNYRVIVDILSADHNLGDKEFYELPNCLIKSIRTSQYAVSPEKIVRIVFDIEKAPIYSIQTGTNSISVSFNDKNTAAFKSWSTVAYLMDKNKDKTYAKAEKDQPSTATKATVTAQKVNKAAEQDRQLSLKNDREEAQKSQKATVKSPSINSLEMQGPPTPKASDLVLEVPKDETTTPPVNKVENKVEKQPVQTAQASPKKETRAVPSSVKKQQQAQQQQVQKETPPAPVKKSTPKYTTAPKTDVSKSKRKESQPVVDKPMAQKKAEPVKETGKKEVAVKPVKKEVAKPEVTVAKKDESSSSTKRSTSRFRRSPVESAKIKGTMVAEFPKRLVIKYKTRALRDPFETLINESKTYDNPIEQRVPNVEGLKLVGIIESNSGSNRALFEDGDGYSYILQSGDKVKKGYVLRVENDRVYFQIFEYGWSRTVALKIDEF